MIGLCPFFDSQRASLPVVVVLPEPCKPDDHDDAGRLVGKPQLGLMRAQHLDQFVADDLDDLLAWAKAR